MINYRRILKPIIEYFISLLVFIFSSPIFLCAILLLFFANNGKVFFIQKRSGLDGKIFNIIKFKTMNDKRDRKGELLPDNERLTKVGKTIRNLSLDEIPQLINILKGDMALIGPRPLLPEYLTLYDSFQFRRHEVKPGITGLAQVNGRNTLSWQDRFKLDVYYVDNLSLKLDIKIAFLTVYKVFKREGISAQDHVTMEKFKGN